MVILKILFAVLLLSAAMRAQATFVPDSQLKEDDYTVLMVADARLAPGLQPFGGGGHGKFFVSGWRQPSQEVTWAVTVPDDSDYLVNVLLKRLSGQPLRIEVSSTGGAVLTTLPAGANMWTRQPFDGLLHLKKGPQTIKLRISRADGVDFDVQVLSVELVRPAVQKRLHLAALKMRSDTKWLQQARYGFMFHWTSQTMPPTGDPKPYEQAVRDFNVERFADQVKAGGAGFVVLTTSHAYLYFPARIEALDKALSDRTTKRDLVGEIADALNKRGIRLILYYHLGSAEDPDWLKSCGFYDTDTSKLFGTWERIIGEVGRRYGKRLSGWWFDDGSTGYYYRSAPWERLERAAKAGSSERVVGFNPWEMPTPTEFHDLHVGEGCDNPSGVGGILKLNGDGHYPSGANQGLQACATLITEGDWVHSRRDSEIGAPRWNSKQMADMLTDFGRYRNVPIFNLEIYQDGTVSPVTVEMFRQARQILEAQGK